MHLIGFRFDYSTRDKVTLARRLLGILRSLLCIIGRLMLFSDRRSNFWMAFERILDRLRDGTLRYGHTESNLRTSLRSYVYSVYYRTGRCRIKGVLQRPAVKDISRKSPCQFFSFSFIHTYIHTYIHTVLPISSDGTRNWEIWSGRSPTFSPKYRQSKVDMKVYKCINIHMNKYK